MKEIVRNFRNLKFLRNFYVRNFILFLLTYFLFILSLLLVQCKRNFKTFMRSFNHLDSNFDLI